MFPPDVAHDGKTCSYEYVDPKMDRKRKVSGTAFHVSRHLFRNLLLVSVILETSTFCSCVVSKVLSTY